MKIDEAMRNRLTNLIGNAIRAYYKKELKFHGVSEEEYISEHLLNDVIVLPIRCSDELVEEMSTWCYNRCVDERENISDED